MSTVAAAEKIKSLLSSVAANRFEAVEACLSDACQEALELTQDLDTTTVYFDEDCYAIGRDHGWTYGGPFAAAKTYRWEALLTALEELSVMRAERGLQVLDALIEGVKAGREDCDDMFLREQNAGQPNE